MFAFHLGYVFYWNDFFCYYNRQHLEITNTTRIQMLRWLFEYIFWWGILSEIWKQYSRLKVSGWRYLSNEVGSIFRADLVSFLEPRASISMHLQIVDSACRMTRGNQIGSVFGTDLVPFFDLILVPFLEPIFQWFLWYQFFFGLCFFTFYLHIEISEYYPILRIWQNN